MKKLISILLALTVLLAFAACGAKTEPVNKTTQGIQDDVTEPAIFTITVLHGDGEESSSRMTTDCDNLAAALIERNFMTEDMLTIGGEKADPANNAYWTLYIDGVYATESWDKIPIEGGVEYMFEYTVDENLGEPVEDEENGDEGPVEEIPVEDEVVEDTTAA